MELRLTQTNVFPATDSWDGLLLQKLITNKHFFLFCSQGSVSQSLVFCIIVYTVNKVFSIRIHLANIGVYCQTANKH